MADIFPGDRVAHNRSWYVVIISQLRGLCAVPFSQEVADGGLVQSFFFVKKLGHRLCSPFQQVVLNQVMDTLKEGGVGSQIIMNITVNQVHASQHCPFLHTEMCFMWLLRVQSGMFLKYQKLSCQSFIEILISSARLISKTVFFFFIWVTVVINYQRKKLRKVKWVFHAVISKSQRLFRAKSSKYDPFFWVRTPAEYFFKSIAHTDTLQKPLTPRSLQTSHLPTRTCPRAWAQSGRRPRDSVFNWGRREEATKKTEVAVVKWRFCTTSGNRMWVFSLFRLPLRLCTVCISTSALSLWSDWWPSDPEELSESMSPTVALLQLYCFNCWIKCSMSPPKMMLHTFCSGVTKLKYCVGQVRLHKHCKSYWIQLKC